MAPAAEAAPTKRTRPSDRGEQTRRKILDAAELLFAERGYHGVSIRDITLAAQVENALASYHFGTKQRLFTAVVERRSEEHRGDLLASLAAAHAEAAPGAPDNAALVRAYAGPALAKIERSPGWAAYVKLIVGIQNLDREDEASLLTSAAFEEPIRLFVEAFLRANPGLPPRRVLWGVHFLHGTLIHILSQGRGFHRLTGDEQAYPDTEELLDALAHFVANGLRD